MAVFLVDALSATVEISAEQASTVLIAIENNAFHHVQQFFRQLYDRDGEEAVLAYANIRNSENRTPLHLARGPEMFETLVHNGANLDIRDSQGHLPLVSIFLRNPTVDVIESSVLPAKLHNYLKHSL